MQRRFFLQGLSAALAAPLLPGELMAQTPPREAATPDAASRIAVAQQRLVMQLLLRLHASGANVVISPTSLASVLSVLSFGASPRMQAAIRHALGYRPRNTAHVADDLRALRAAITAEIKPDAPLKMANAIVFDPASRPHELALRGLQALNVRASVETLSDPQAAAKINAWVKQETNDRIPSIIDEPITDAGLVALNALYFKDRWKIPFDPAETKTTPFMKAGGKSADVPMMMSDRPRRFRQDEHFVAVDLPYATERFSLVVLTAKRVVAPLRMLIRRSSWLGGAGFAQVPGELRLPRFTLSQGAHLLPALDRMGLAPARYSPVAFSGLAALPQRLARVDQKTFLAVDEAGTEAAAATAAVTSRSAESEIVKMTVDKPFLFALRDMQSGLVVLAGYVTDPLAGA